MVDKYLEKQGESANHADKVAGNNVKMTELYPDLSLVSHSLTMWNFHLQSNPG